MKKLFIIPALGAMLATSCADDKLAEYRTEQPQNAAEYMYLNEYDVLKNYVNSNANPNFKLGIALAVDEFLQQEQVYAMACSNFNEMTAGNAMKYSSCVDDKGNMDFAKVSEFVSTARNASLTIYGHTLAWHSQQNNKYLNSLLADKELPPAEGKGYCLHIQTPEAKANPWDWQCYYDLATPMTPGKSYSFSMRIKASAATSFPFWIETPGAGNTHYGLPQIAAGNTWGDVSFDITPNSDCSRLLFNFGQFGGDLYLDDMVLIEKGTEENLLVNGDFESDDLAAWSKPGWHSHLYGIEATPGDAVAEIFTDIITNGDAEGSETANFSSTHIGGSNGACDIVEGAGKEGGRAFVVTSGGGGVNSWDTQFFLSANRPLEENEVVHIAFDYRADVPNNSESQAHSTPGGYIHWDAGCAVSFTTEWQHFEKTITINSTLSPSGNMQTFAWNLDVGVPNAPANKYYFDNIKLQIVTQGNTIPLTPEEKKDTLIWAMDNWITGMMNACEGYVTTWDVVNEAIAGGGDDGEGYYPLQSAANVSAEDAKNNFYWQDYLGSIDYVRTAVRLARDRFAESGGNAANLKLFINDYNLESDWDDNKKLKSLIHWIEKWEADGVTHIDGIGTQMHVSCYANAATQESKQNHVVKMLELMAATGKLVKISELDMGYIDENGVSVKTAEMTEEQHKAMAEYYKFIVSKYFEIIPKEQQYGITQWCATDAPANSGWRGGEPVGLWDANYNRKHTYAGFAEGLSGK